MGIHLTYKSQRGERSFRKQQKQEELRKRSNARKFRKKLDQERNKVVVPVDKIITLDLLTNPNKK
jgi:hypothetical protein